MRCVVALSRSADPSARQLAQGQQRAVVNTELRQRPVRRVGISADRTERPAIVVG